MAELVLFHSALGLRPAILRFAERLRAAGHRVHAPDVYDGETFTTVEAGVAKRDAIGRPELMRRWRASVEALPDALVYLGWSLGAMGAAQLAGTRPGARGLILLHDATSPEWFGISRWPSTVPVQLHRAERDPWVEASEVEALRRAVTASGARFEEHVYPGETHLFDDPGVQGHDPRSTERLQEQVLAFLASLDLH